MVSNLGDHDYVGSLGCLGCVGDFYDGYIFTIVIRVTMISLARMVAFVAMITMLILAETNCGTPQPGRGGGAPSGSGQVGLSMDTLG